MSNFQDASDQLEAMSPERRRESEYRRGYADGWIQAAGAMVDLMFKKRLKREVAYDQCFDHWQFTLIDWMRGDCSKTVLPPELGKEVSPFSWWLFAQTNRNDPIGDLARDARRDFTWPERYRDLDSYLGYLEAARADEVMIQALREAWGEWEKGRNV